MLIHFYPSKSIFNDYISVNKNILEANGYQLKPVNYNKSMLNSGGVFISNWLEAGVVANDGSLFLKGFLKAVFILSWVVLRNKKLVWVVHNHREHGAKGVSKYASRFVRDCLDRLCVVKVVHADNVNIRGKNIHYVPHPLYSDELKGKPFSKNGELKSIVFGRVMPYKNIDLLIDSWPDNQSLLIVGKALDQKYGEYISKKCEGKPKITYRNEYISKDELDSILTEMDVAILPHQKNGPIVSGSYFYAKSFGLITMSSGGLNIEGDPYSVCYENTPIDKAIKSAIDLIKNGSKHTVFESASARFGYRVVGEKWVELLDAVQ